MTSEKHLNAAMARRFLLGDVDDSERERIEHLVVMYPEVKQTILIVEEDLIEEFLDGDLSTADNERFLARYASTLPQRNKWQVVEALRRRAASQIVPEQNAAPTVNRSGGFVSSLWRKHPFLIPATALVLILAVVAIWMSVRQTVDLQNDNRLSSVERELSQLNSPSELGTNPPQMFAVVLSPVSTRSATHAPAELDSGTPDTIVEFRLLWIHESDYQNYEAIIRRATTAEQVKVPNLRLTHTERGNVIRLRASANLFERGVYQIILSSFTKDGAPGPVEEYTFISRR